MKLLLRAGTKRDDMYFTFYEADDTVLRNIQLELLDDVSAFVTVTALDSELSSGRVDELIHHNYYQFNIFKPIPFPLIIINNKTIEK